MAAPPPHGLVEARFSAILLIDRARDGKGFFSFLPFPLLGPPPLDRAERALNSHILRRDDFKKEFLGEKVHSIPTYLPLS